MGRPDAARVWARAQVLACVVARGAVEGTGGRAARERTRRDIRGWFEELELGREAEASELGLLDTPVGKAPRQACIDAVWRCEGIVVLLWALKQGEVGPVEVQVPDPREVVASLGYMDRESALDLAKKVRLRPKRDLEAFAEDVLNQHWRLRRFLHRGEVVADCTRLFEEAPIPRVAPVCLVSGDLAVGGRALADADPAAVRSALSVVQERHRAANWLIGDASRYSEVELDT